MVNPIPGMGGQPTIFRASNKTWLDIGTFGNSPDDWPGGGGSSDIGFVLDFVGDQYYTYLNNGAEKTFFTDAQAISAPGQITGSGLVGFSVWDGINGIAMSNTFAGMLTTGIFTVVIEIVNPYYNYDGIHRPPDAQVGDIMNIFLSSGASPISLTHVDITNEGSGFLEVQMADGVVLAPNGNVLQMNGLPIDTTTLRIAFTNMPNLLSVAMNGVLGPTSNFVYTGPFVTFAVTQKFDTVWLLAPLTARDGPGPTIRSVWGMVTPVTVDADLIALPSLLP